MTDIIKEALSLAIDLTEHRPTDKFACALSAYEALLKRVKELEEQNLHFREVLVEANNKWRHEFSEAVDEASDLLFRRLSAPQHFTRALARAALNKEGE